MKKPKKFCFIQNWGTYSNDTFVCVGMNHDEIIRAMKKLKVKKNITTAFEQEREEHNIHWLVPKNHSAVLWFNSGASVLWFPDWKRNWGHISTLIHELYHAVHRILHKDKKMADEDEACAYQLEFLFKEIRRKLDKEVL